MTEINGEVLESTKSTEAGGSSVSVIVFACRH